MKWIEMVRVCGCDDDRVEDLLNGAIGPHLDALRTTPGCLRVGAFRHCQCPGNFAIIAVWSGSNTPAESREILALADYLQAYGLVDHVAWVEVGSRFALSEQDCPPQTATGSTSCGEHASRATQRSRRKTSRSTYEQKDRQKRGISDVPS